MAAGARLLFNEMVRRWMVAIRRARRRGRAQATYLCPRLLDARSEGPGWSSLALAPPRFAREAAPSICRLQTSRLAGRRIARIRAGVAGPRATGLAGDGGREREAVAVGCSREERAVAGA